MSAVHKVRDAAMDQQSVSPAPGELPRPPGRSIRLFLADGTPQGIITAEIINWTGKALCAPRARLPDLLKRGEAGRTGIYILLGPDPDRPGQSQAYIGEADNIAARMRTHLRAEEKGLLRAAGDRCRQGRQPDQGTRPLPGEPADPAHPRGGLGRPRQ